MNILLVFWTLATFVETFSVRLPVQMTTETGPTQIMPTARPFGDAIVKYKAALYRAFDGYHGFIPT